jgi:hypothetical protein
MHDYPYYSVLNLKRILPNMQARCDNTNSCCSCDQNNITKSTMLYPHATPSAPEGLHVDMLIRLLSKPWPIGITSLAVVVKEKSL